MQTLVDLEIPSSFKEKGLKEIHHTYKIINTITDQYYIGVHTSYGVHPCDDPYMGSGLDLKENILKYGKDKFKKEILGFFKTKEEAEENEKILIQTNSALNEKCLNLVHNKNKRAGRPNKNEGEELKSRQAIMFTEEQKQIIERRRGAGRLLSIDSSTFIREWLIRSGMFDTEKKPVLESPEENLNNSFK